PGPRRRRRSDLVRSAEAAPEAVLPHADGPRLHLRQRGLPRLLPLADARSARLRAMVRGDAVGTAVPAIRPDGAARAAARRRHPRDVRADVDADTLKLRFTVRGSGFLVRLASRVP